MKAKKFTTKPKSRNPRATLAKSIRAAKSNGERASLARHGKRVGMMVHHAGLLAEFREWESAAKLDGQRATLREAIRDTEAQLCRYFLNAVNKRDPKPLRELAAYFKKADADAANSDPLREKLAWLALKLEEKNWPDGEKCCAESVSQVADIVKYRGNLRPFRRMLRDMKFPVEFGNASKVAAGSRKREKRS